MRWRRCSDSVRKGTGCPRLMEATPWCGRRSACKDVCSGFDSDRRLGLRGPFCGIARRSWISSASRWLSCGAGMHLSAALRYDQQSEPSFGDNMTPGGIDWLTKNANPETSSNLPLPKKKGSSNSLLWSRLGSPGSSRRNRKTIRTSQIAYRCGVPRIRRGLLMLTQRSNIGSQSSRHVRRS
jgi:hypothetical protein